MKAHYGVNYETLCKASVIEAKRTTTDPNAVDCLACLFTLQGSMLHQLDVCSNRIREVTNEQLNPVIRSPEAV